MNSSLLEKNANIIYNETLFIAQSIGQPTTISGQPIIITGYDTYVITGPIPNPQAGILNSRFLAQTSISLNINSAKSKLNSILKNKTEKNISASQDGMASSNSKVKKIIGQIRDVQKQIPSGNSDGSDIKTIYFEQLITTTATDIIKKKLHTQIKLPSPLLDSYAIQIANKCVYDTTNYGMWDFNKLIAITILKIMNF
jgi:hypothetical protein